MAYSEMKLRVFIRQGIFSVYRRIVRGGLHVIRSDALGLLYLPVPKVGGSTMRHAIFLAENGIAYKDSHYARDLHISRFYSRPRHWSTPSRIDRETGKRKIVIVRDPVARLLSCYADRVAKRKDIARDPVARKEAQRNGLPVLPDVDTFMRFIDTYTEMCASIRHHTVPQCKLIAEFVFLNGVEVVDLSQMGGLLQWMQEASGVSGLDKHYKVTADHKRIDFRSLSVEARRKLMEFVEEDFTLLERLGFDYRNRYADYE